MLQCLIGLQNINICSYGVRLFDMILVTFQIELDYDRKYF